MRFLSPPLVVVVGSLNADLVARVPRLPARGETLASDGFSVVAGGKGANQAVAAARLGARTAMVGCVGDDGHGRMLLDGLRREQIDTTAVRTTPTEPTGLALIAVDTLSDNTIVLVPGANATVGEADVDAATGLLAQAEVVICQLEIPLETVRDTLRRAKALGKTTVLNPAPARPLDAGLLALVDYLIPNEVEAAMLSGVDVHDPASAARAAAVLLKAGCRNVLVTLGPQGVLHAHAGGMHCHAARVVEAVDTTAAGDTFIGGFSAHLAAARPLADCIRFGQVAAGIAVTRRGAQPSIPSRAEVLLQF